MRIAIACNHSWPHIGGSETVIHAIGSGLAKLGHDVFILSRTVNKPQKHEGVHYKQVKQDFISQVNEFNLDNLFVYSDCFLYWPLLLKNIKQLNCRLSIALVGMNHMRESVSSRKIFSQNKDIIDVVTHSDNYLDYKTCIDIGIKPHVIPNGVDVNEFQNCSINIRDIHNIETPYLITCVSNFFPGKGQEHLAIALQRLAKQRQDFTVVFYSARVNLPYAVALSSNVERTLKRSSFKCLFLKDRPRQEVVSAFKNSDLFAFPSQKEVAPIVVLESMAAATPWVALPVGNIPEMPGGLLAPIRGHDPRGYAKWGEETYDTFVGHMNTLLSNKDKNFELSQEGFEYIDKHRDWKKIIPLYEKLFKKHVS